MSDTERDSDPDFKRMVVDIPEAQGKRIQKLLIEEPYSDTYEFHVLIVFDDESELVLDLESRLKFAVAYFQQIDGNVEQVTEHPARFLRP